MQPGASEGGTDGEHLGSVRVFGHNGGAPGIRADLKIFPRSGYVVAVLTNSILRQQSESAPSSPRACR
jgi:hypothetical protein